MKKTVYIGMGSSKGNKKNTIMGAFYALQTIDSNATLSMLYENEAWGGVAKNMFINAVCQIKTDLDPFLLLERLQMIELAFGRTREIRWDDRTLDLDILLYGEEIINSPTLTIPHPGVWERDSVLVPLKDIIGEKMVDQIIKNGNTYTQHKK